jgi:uncharacterized OB-fold protein
MRIILNNSKRGDMILTKKFQEPSEIKLFSWECPNCHHVNTKNGFYCEKCGSRNINTYG